jgi:hypothetical protein
MLWVRSMWWSIGLLVKKGVGCNDDFREDGSLRMAFGFVSWPSVIQRLRDVW